MENSLYIYHHMGMGDHALCNAIIRHYAEKYEKVYNFAKPHNAKNVAYMYRDLSNVKIIALDDRGAQFFMHMNPNNKYLIVGITQDWFKRFERGEFETFDHGFYVAAGIPLEDKWNKFYFQRDMEAEKNAYYNKLGLVDGEKYLFVHDDKERGRFFRSEYIDKGLKIIRPVDHKNVGLFDFLYTIEHAEEVHVMNSSFSCLLDTAQIYNPKLYYHQYARTDMGDNPNHKLKMNWTIIK